MNKLEGDEALRRRTQEARQQTEVQHEVQESRPRRLTRSEKTGTLLSLTSSAFDFNLSRPAFDRLMHELEIEKVRAFVRECADMVQPTRAMSCVGDEPPHAL